VSTTPKAQEHVNSTAYHTPCLRIAPMWSGNELCSRDVISTCIAERRYTWSHSFATIMAVTCVFLTEMREIPVVIGFEQCQYAEHRF